MPAWIKDRMGGSSRRDPQSEAIAENIVEEHGWHVAGLVGLQLINDAVEKGRLCQEQVEFVLADVEERTHQ